MFAIGDVPPINWRATVVGSPPARTKKLDFVYLSVRGNQVALSNSPSVRAGGLPTTVARQFIGGIPPVLQRLRHRPLFALASSIPYHRRGVASDFQCTASL